MVAMNPAAAWYNELSAKEAREVHDLEQIMEGAKTALRVASARREAIQNRAHMRHSWKCKTGKSVVPTPRGMDSMPSATHGPVILDGD